MSVPIVRLVVWQLPESLAPDGARAASLPDPHYRLQCFRSAHQVRLALRRDIGATRPEEFVHGSVERRYPGGPVPLPARSFLHGCFLLCAHSVCAACRAETDLAGYWVLHVDNGNGTVRDTFLELNQDGESITGTLSARSAWNADHRTSKMAS